MYIMIRLIYTHDTKVYVEKKGILIEVPSWVSYFDNSGAVERIKILANLMQAAIGDTDQRWEGVINPFFDHRLCAYRVEGNVFDEFQYVKIKEP